MSASNPSRSDRDLRTSVSQVFGSVRKGTECRVCGRDVDDGRAVYCSDYCRNLSRAVLDLLNWSGVRRRVLKRDDRTCQSCGAEGGTLEVDHITPISEGGHPFDPGNLQTLCVDCHQEKTAEENTQTPSRQELNESLFDYLSNGGESGAE